MLFCLLCARYAKAATSDCGVAHAGTPYPLLSIFSDPRCFETVLTNMSIIAQACVALETPLASLYGSVAVVHNGELEWNAATGVLGGPLGATQMVCGPRNASASVVAFMGATACGLGAIIPNASTSVVSILSLPVRGRGPWVWSALYWVGILFCQRFILSAFYCVSVLLCQ